MKNLLTFLGVCSLPVLLLAAGPAKKAAPAAAPKVEYQYPRMRIRDIPSPDKVCNKGEAPLAFMLPVGHTPVAVVLCGDPKGPKAPDGGPAIYTRRLTAIVIKDGDDITEY